MSFLRSIFVAKPTQTDEQYVNTLVQQICDGKPNEILISKLADFSQEYSNQISERAIPALINNFSLYIENEDIVYALITIFANLLRMENSSKEENAEKFLKCSDSIPAFVKVLDSSNDSLSEGSMHVLMMLANLKPDLFIEALTSNQTQMIRLFETISDTNLHISSKFVSTLPSLVANNPDFQQIVCFYSIDSLVNHINRDHPEFLNALNSLLQDNKVNQSLFVKSGYLKSIENMIKTPDTAILNLLSIIFDPVKNNDELPSYRQKLEDTNIITYLCDNIIRNIYRLTNIHLLSVCIKGETQLINQTKDRLHDIVRLSLESRKSADGSDYDGIELFGEFFESFVFNSEENSHFLNDAITKNENEEFRAITDNFLDLCTYSILSSPECKSDFNELFTQLLNEITLRDSTSNLLQFFIAFCWQSKESTLLLSNDTKLTHLIQLQVKASHNLSSDPSNFLLLLLFGEIILFSGKNKSNVSDVILATILPTELKRLINSNAETSINQKTKIGQFENVIVQYINEHNLTQSLDLTQSNQELIDVTSKGEDENIELRKTIQKLNEQLKMYEDEINKIKEENESAIQLKTKEMESETDTVREENRQLNENCAEMKRQNSELVDNIANLQNEIEVLKSKNEQLNKNISEMQQKNSELIQFWETKMNESQNQSEIRMQQAENDKIANEKIEKMTKEISDLNDKLLFQDETIKAAENEKDQLQKELENLKNQLENFQTDNQPSANSQNESIAELQNQNNELNTKITTTENEKIQLQKELAETKSQLEGLKAALNEYQSNSKLENESIAELQNQNNELKMKIITIQNENSKLIQDLADLNDQKEKVVNENSELRQSLNEVSNQKERIEDENAKLLNNLTALNNEKEQIQNENTKLLIDLSNEKEQIQNENTKLKQMIDNNQNEHQKQLNDLSKSNSQLKEESSSNQNQLQIRNDELERQLKELTEMNDSNASIHQSIDLQQKIDLLETQLKEKVDEIHQKDQTIQALTENQKQLEMTQQEHTKMANELMKTNQDLRTQLDQILPQIKELEQLANRSNSEGSQQESEGAAHTEDESSHSIEENTPPDSEQVRTNSNEKKNKAKNNSEVLPSPNEVDDTENHDKLIEMFKQEIENLKRDNQILKNELDSKNQYPKANYESIVAKQRKLIDDLTAQNDKLEKSALEHLESIDQLTSRNSQLAKELKAQTISFKRNSVEIKAKLKQALQENSELRSQLYSTNQSNSKISVLNKSVKKLTSLNEQLRSENKQLKSNSLVVQLQEDKARLSEKIQDLQAQLYSLRNSQKGLFTEDDDQNISKLLKEINILKRDNENQSHTITDLQQMLNTQSHGSQLLNQSEFDTSFNEEMMHLSIENELLNSKLNEMKEVEQENRRIHHENMELKKMIRDRAIPSFFNGKDTKNTPIISNEEQKKALRMIGKLWLEQHTTI